MTHGTTRRTYFKYLLHIVLVAIPFAGWGAVIGQDPQRLARLPKLVDKGAPRPQLGITHGGDPRAAVGGPFPYPEGFDGRTLMLQTKADADAKSAGCIQCHRGVGDMHKTGTLHLGCVDCHGGNPSSTDKLLAHVAPRFPGAWRTSANPVRSYTLLNHESPEFIRFVNPGDLRIAHISCGSCHANEVLQVRTSMMTHGCMLWGAALYNNGSVPNKYPRYGESYSMNGTPQRVLAVPQPTINDIRTKLELPFLEPLPRFEITQPGNTLRIFERGGRFRTEIGIPERLEETGRPRERLSVRGFGTENRTDPVFIGLQKTRLLDPTLNFLGTNDHAGDYRSSGCSSCHVVYANDRSPVHSGPYARYGNRGTSFSADPMIPQNESGHPIKHEFTLSVPTSQCIICHVHPGTNVLNSYLGYMWWDNETDGEVMYPTQSKEPTAEEVARSYMSNPEGAAVRGKWSNPSFLENVTDLNPRLKHTQFADFHGHGWVFRAVFKKDRKGNLLDHRGEIVPKNTRNLMAAVAPPKGPERGIGKHRDGVPVHLMDIHLEKGMHCIDCHFIVDNHGNTKLYGEVRAAIEIKCVDCHGTAEQSIPDRIAATGRMETTGPAAPPGGNNLLQKRTPFGKPRFELVGQKLFQNSMVEADLRWELVQTAATIDPQSDHYNIKSHMAKTVRFEEGQIAWGGNPGQAQCAHKNQRLSCIACHSSWNPSCFGCHLPQKANFKMPDLHNEGEVSRNYTEYNFQTLRDDVYMLGHDGNVTGRRIGPVRSACAIHVTSYNSNRETIYIQQQTISADGLSGISFAPNVPHTVRGGPGMKHGNVVPGTTETKMCSDCHLSKQNDNNAIMAQLLMQGTNYTNFIGRYCYVAAGEHGFEAVIVTEIEEPQAVIGSTLHKLAYPNRYEEHVHHDRHLHHMHEHPGIDILDGILRPFEEPEILSLQARGEYLYAACGSGGLRVFDIAFIDHKNFSERITTAPVSPIGQKFYVKTTHATSVAAPATTAPDPTRVQSAANEEPKVHPINAFIYVTDAHEGLILVGAGTLLDGDPTNNFLERALTYNPNNVLAGARSITMVGTYAYICANAGLVVVSLDNPTEPVITAVVGSDVLKNPKAVQVQFRYAMVCDDVGIKVLDVTDLANPRPISALALPDARNIYLARTYAYVAGGKQGLVILDITNPEEPRVDQVFNAGGAINDLNDVKLGITNASEFAYLADGHHGLRVVQLTSAQTPGTEGFSPRPTPMLIATHAMHKEGGEALAISKGVDRDRAVDETGNQLSVFGRIGAGPLSLKEQRKMFLHQGKLYRVSDNPFDDDLYRFPVEVHKRAQATGATAIHR